MGSEEAPEEGPTPGIERPEDPKPEYAVSMMISEEMDVNKVMARELEDSDIRKLLPGIRITMYKDLEGRALNTLVDNEGRGIIFFAESAGKTTISGHWLAIIVNGQGVEVFDPYGGTQDPWGLDHTWVADRSLVALHEDKPLLDALIRRSGMQPIFNDTRLQQMKRGIETCGRHCVVRLWNMHMTSPRYASWLKAQGDPDVVVSRMTFNKLGY